MAKMAVCFTHALVLLVGSGTNANDSFHCKICEKVAQCTRLQDIYSSELSADVKTLHI